MLFIKFLVKLEVQQIIIHWISLKQARHFQYRNGTQKNSLNNIYLMCSRIRTKNLITHPINFIIWYSSKLGWWALITTKIFLYFCIILRIILKRYWRKLCSWNVYNILYVLYVYCMFIILIYIVYCYFRSFKTSMYDYFL